MVRSLCLVPALLAALATALPQHAMHQATALVSRAAPNLTDEAEVEEAFREAVKARDARQLKKRANQLIPVVVGGRQVIFMPNMMLAAIGDVIQFQFADGNHTVTQSTETEACQPLQKSNPAAVHSGHHPFKAGQTTVDTFNVPITDTKPMFLYCATGPHCQLGQVMIINPSNTAQVVNYAKLSSAAKANVDGGAPSGGTAATIQLSAAAFIPAPPDPAAPPPAAPAPAPGPGAAPAPSGTPGKGNGGKKGKGKEGGGGAPASPPPAPAPAPAAPAPPAAPPAQPAPAPAP